ncbi:MAG: TetR/AcrR family transcriptional regulator [Ilumatobacteraceae bacterium]
MTASHALQLDALRADTSNRGRLLLAALEQIDRIGIDSITASDLIGQAGVSRSTLYSYFGDVLGVIADVWAACGAEWLEQLTGGTDAQRDRSIDSAMVALLCTARRSPLLNEVVQPDVDAMWADVASRGEIEMMKAAWTLAGVIGTELTAPIIPEARHYELVNSTIRSMPANARELVGLTGEPLPVDRPVASSPVELEEASVTARLTRAAVEVVAGSQFEATSMMRVCRVARLSTGAATPRFAGLRALHERANANTEVVPANAAQFDSFTSQISPPDTNAIFVRSSLSASRQLWRRYRRELHLAARHDADLAAMMLAAFDESNEMLRAALSRAEVSTEVVDMAVLFNQVTAVGLGAVADLRSPVNDLDHRLPIRWLYLHVIGQDRAA